MFARGVVSFQPARLPAYSENSASPIIPTLARRSRNSNHSRTYGIPGGRGCTGSLVRPIRRASKPFVSPTYAKTEGYAPCGKCRRADIFDFSPYFSHFSCGGRYTRTRGHDLSCPYGGVGVGGSWLVYGPPGWRRYASPLSVTSLQYPAPIALGVARTEPIRIPARSGSPRCGYVPFAYRCPDAHD
jgi:hypothetical protein